MLVIARHNGFEYILATVDSTEAALPEDHFPDDAPEVTDIFAEDTPEVEESTQVVDDTQPEQSQDMTYSFVVLFALGIIAGLLFFSIFSRKWD